MTVAELKQRMTFREGQEWLAVFVLEAEEREAARRQGPGANA